MQIDQFLTDAIKAKVDKLEKSRISMAKDCTRYRAEIKVLKSQLDCHFKLFRTFRDTFENEAHILDEACLKYWEVTGY